MTIEEAEKLLDDLATMEELICKRADDASGYTRNRNESIRTSNAKTHEQHAKEYRQILRYLAEYRLMQADYENRLRADMVAMITEIQLEIEELDLKDSVPNYQKGADETREYITDLLEQKINSLKAESEDNNGSNN